METLFLQQFYSIRKQMQKKFLFSPILSQLQFIHLMMKKNIKKGRFLPPLYSEWEVKAVFFCSYWAIDWL